MRTEKFSWKFCRIHICVGESFLFLVDHCVTQPTIILRTLGKHDEAEPLYKISQEIFEISVGRDHSNFAAVLSKRVLLSIYMFLRCSRSDYYSNTTPLPCPLHGTFRGQGRRGPATS